MCDTIPRPLRGCLARLPLSSPLLVHPTLAGPPDNSLWCRPPPPLLSLHCPTAARTLVALSHCPTAPLPHCCTHTGGALTFVFCCGQGAWLCRSTQQACHSLLGTPQHERGVALATRAGLNGTVRHACGTCVPFSHSLAEWDSETYSPGEGGWMTWADSRQLSHAHAMGRQPMAWAHGLSGHGLGAGRQGMGCGPMAWAYARRGKTRLA